MLVRVNKCRGFTLIELAVVLFIVSLMLGVFLSPLSVRLEQQNRARTTDLLDEIEESLLGYAMINGRLPCPDCPNTSLTGCGSATANDGREDLTGTICASPIGNLPWVDLQVSEYDDWSRHFTYRVKLEFADDADGAPAAGVGGAAPCGTPAIGVSFEICSGGDIDIYDGYIIGTTGYTTAALLAANVSIVAENVPAIVISHGSDTYESLQSDQQVENWYDTPWNPDANAAILSSYTSANFTSAAFIYTGFAKDSSLNPPIKYDDLMIWISPAILMNRMVVSGKLP